MNARSHRSYGSRQISGKRARAALTMLLAGCTDEKLAGFTGAELARHFNVGAAEAERALVVARQVRQQRRMLT